MLNAAIKNDDELYANLFPKRQLYIPKKEYPLCDANWDNRQPTPLENKDEERKKQRWIRKSGTTRHIILIRHGQYDETHKEDEKRTLTKLGREQADLTGKRIAKMIRGSMASPSTIQKTDEGHEQVEAAFQKYFFRSTNVERDDAPTDDNDSPESHEFEIIVCHANVIRYFLCRA